MNTFTRNFVCKLTFFYKIVKRNSPQYLSNYLKGNNNSVYKTRSASQISLNSFRTRTEKLKKSVFLFCISDWNKLNNLKKQSENIKKLKNALTHDPQGVKLLSQVRLNFSQLNEHKFRYCLKECVSHVCGCGLEIESTQHFFSRFHFCHVERSGLLNSLYLAQISIIKRQIEKYFLTVLLTSKLLKDLMNHFSCHRQ